MQSVTDVVVSDALDGMAARHRAYVNNLANMETPGFEPSDVPFETQLRKVRDEMVQHGGDTSRAEPLTLTPVQSAPPTDPAGAPADTVDQQVMKMEENTLAYAALTQAEHSRISILHSVISEGH